MKYYAEGRQNGPSKQIGEFFSTFLIQALSLIGSNYSELKLPSINHNKMKDTAAHTD